MKSHKEWPIRHYAGRGLAHLEKRAHAFIHILNLLLAGCVLQYGMGEISLDMVWKRLEEMQADLKAARTDLSGINEKLGGIATTLVGVQRDVRSLQGTVATLGVAVDDHTHRLDRIEQRLGIDVTPN